MPQTLVGYVVDSFRDCSLLERLLSSLPIDKRYQQDIENVGITRSKASLQWVSENSFLFLLSRIRWVSKQVQFSCELNCFVEKVGLIVESSSILSVYDAVEMTVPSMFVA